MLDRSLLGTALLLAASSCVPPPMAGAARAPAIAPNGPVTQPADALAGRAGDGRSPVLSLIDTIASLPPAPPFERPAQAVEDAERSLDCLTAAVYYEARSEPLDGQRAVAQVVLNRVRNQAFPNSVCGVVYEGALRTTGCQFSFTCDGSMAFRREPEAWERAREVAQAALGGSVFPDVGSATFYHTTAILPWWASSLTRITTIGAHIFYRWPGRLGDVLAFGQRYSGVEPDPALAAQQRSDAALVQYALADSAGVTVRRGATGVPAALAQGDGGEAVHVHFGGAPTAAPTSPAPAPAPRDEAAAVTIHRGDAAPS